MAEILLQISLAHPMRLDVYLAQNKICTSRAEAVRWISEARVLLNLVVPKPSQTVKNGDQLKINPPELKPAKLEPQNLDLDIIYEDTDLLVVNKPSGLVVHPGAGNYSTSLVHGLLYQIKNLSGIGGVERPGIVHRLDKDTSGLMVVAKNDLTHQSLTKQFSDKKIHKEYLALCRGAVLPLTHTFSSLLKRSEQNRKRFVVNQKKGKLAVTHYHVLKQNTEVTLAHIKIDTGRTHQIRVHFSFAEFPLLGDEVYGGLKAIKRLAEEFKSCAHVHRTLLHSFRLGFQHPKTKKQMTFRQSPPNDFMSVTTELLSFKNWDIPQWGAFDRTHS